MRRLLPLPLFLLLACGTNARSGLPRFYLILADFEARVVRTPRLQRAVGVIYRPMDEYASHYYTATMAEQFDAIIHIDDTRALEPL